MSSLAHILLDMGLEVYGSDKSPDSPSVRLLRSRGAELFFDARNLDTLPVDAVIFSTAIDRNTNPIYLEFKRKNIPALHRSELLHRIFALKKSIAVAGSHGKTSTTAMVSQILVESGMDPAVMVGGEVSFLGGRGGRWGEGEWGVYESDESDGTFLNHSPAIKIITNIDNDHLDYYKSFDNLLKSFSEYIENKNQSKSVVYSPDKGIQKVLKSITDRNGIVSYSDDESPEDLSNIKFTISDDSLSFQKNKIHYSISLPFKGDHYLKNSLAAVLAAELAGVPIVTSISILKKYAGVKRRLEFLGEKSGVRVYDDYGHHPTEIFSVINSLKRMKNGNGRCVVLFQPHRFTRTKELFKEFSSTLGESDFVFLLPIYSAGEKPIEGISSELILKNFSDIEKIQLLSGEKANDVSSIGKLLRKDDILVTLGAGNVREWGELFLQ